MQGGQRLIAVENAQSSGRHLLIGDTAGMRSGARHEATLEPGVHTFHSIAAVRADAARALNRR